jgi:hypothetical protein
MKSSRAVFGLLATALLTSTSLSQEVSGSFVVKGASTSLNHGYAYWKDQAPFRKGVMNLYVLLSDVPVAERALPSDDRAIDKIAEPVRNDRIHALELHFSDGGETLFSAENGAVYHNGIASARHGVNGFFHYQMLKFDGTTLEGKMWMDPDSVTLAGWKADATFKVKVPPKP